jgi:hypothetical protein
VRIDPDTCRDADLLAAEVRRLQGVITASEPTLTDAERAAIKVCESAYSDNDMDAGCWQIAATLRGLLERTK